jgi:Zn-finger nucleic acid-binding protein
MDCPGCGGRLQERTHVGVVVDICDRCRGIWLDRGELEKIVAVLHAHEREKASTRASQAEPDGAQADRSLLRKSTWSRVMQLFD